MSIEQQLLIVEPGEGERVDIGGMGVDFKVWGRSTGGRLSVVEHPMEPGRLVPPHIHRDEDELSYVLEGTFGARIGDRVVTAAAGSYLFKPRGVPHTFWNAGPGPARLIEILWPAGFERFFDQLGELARTLTDPQDFDARRADLAARYHVSFLPAWVPELKDRFHLKVLGEP
jgi:quercetin dioxygenase-like cupin family protein